MHYFSLMIIDSIWNQPLREVPKSISNARIYGRQWLAELAICCNGVTWTWQDCGDEALQHLLSNMTNSSLCERQTPQEIWQESKETIKEKNFPEFAHSFNPVPISSLLKLKMQWEWVRLQSLTKLTNKRQMFKKILQRMGLQRNSLLSQGYWVHLKHLYQEIRKNKIKFLFTIKIIFKRILHQRK